MEIPVWVVALIISAISFGTLILAILRIRSSRRFIKALSEHNESQIRLGNSLTELGEVLTEHGEVLTKLGNKLSDYKRKDQK